MSYKPPGRSCRSCSAKISNPNHTFCYACWSVKDRGTCRSCGAGLRLGAAEQGHKLCYSCWRNERTRENEKIREVVLALEGAIDKNLDVNVTYFSYSRSLSTIRKITPERIYLGTNGVQYLEGFCHFRKEVRTFRIGRITKIQSFSERAVLPQEIETIASRDPEDVEKFVSNDSFTIPRRRHHSLENNSSRLEIEHIWIILAAGLVIVIFFL